MSNEDEIKAKREACEQAINDLSKASAEGEDSTTMIHITMEVYRKLGELQIAEYQARVDAAGGVA